MAGGAPAECNGPGFVGTLRPGECVQENPDDAELDYWWPKRNVIPAL